MSSETPSSANSAATIVNIAAYHFAPIADGDALRAAWQAAGTAFALKGTILIAPEGINLFLAGTAQSIEAMLALIRRDARFSKLRHKQSLSAAQPFKRLKIKMKREIITMGRPLIEPDRAPSFERAPAVSPVTLKRWLDAGHDDDGRPIALVDTRNAFEVDQGSFDDAVDFRIGKFTDFTAPALADRDRFAEHTVVTFCTGGIRCEKAAIVLREGGYQHVVQLDGGILQYFEDVGGAHFHGNCFVFDERIALDASLRPAQ